MKQSVKYQNPYSVERYRDLVARRGDIESLSHFYGSSFPEIRNSNGPSFWDNKITKDRYQLEHYYMYRDKIEIVSKYLVHKKGSLCDIGFGWAKLEAKINKLDGLEVFGVDISTKAVDYARKNLNGSYRVGNILHLPYKNRKFDIVIALDILEHIVPSKVILAYNEVRRVLKNNGELVISVPINENLEAVIKKRKNFAGHVRMYTSSLINAELRLAGFKIKRTKTLYAFRNNYLVKKLIINTLPIKLIRPNLLIIFAQKI
jgi:2-polyprenyl-3-methyl-5-hydroxy-6-metoxy-1,4-benzoquinol methylase